MKPIDLFSSSPYILDNMDYTIYASKGYHDFTLSLPYEYNIPAHIQHEVAIAKIKRLFNLCSDHYIIYPEFSAQCRLHYHGLIRIKDKVKFIRSVYNALKVNVAKVIQFRPSRSFKLHLGWVTYYIRKEWLITKQVLRIEHPIIFRRATVKQKKEIQLLSPQNDPIPEWFHQQVQAYPDQEELEGGA